MYLMVSMAMVLRFMSLYSDAMRKHFSEYTGSLLYYLLVAYAQLHNVNFTYCMCMEAGALVHGMLVGVRAPPAGARSPLPPVSVTELSLSGWSAASHSTS